MKFVEPEDRQDRAAISCSTTVRAKAGDFDHGRLRHEAGSPRRVLDRIGNGFGRGFAHRAALLAYQEHDWRHAFMIVHAGNECVSALDSMHEILLAQKIECPINGDRRRPRASQGQSINQFIGAERVMTSQQSLEHPAANWREPLLSGATDRFRVGNGIGSAPRVVVIRFRKDRSGS